MMATQRDPFLDPFAKWCAHTLQHLRKLGKRNPGIAARALAQCRASHPKTGACNGFANVLAYLFSELGWQVISPEAGTSLTEYGEFSIISFSDGFFSDILAASLRTYLVHQQSPRHEMGDIPPDSQVDSVLTRIILDSSCTQDEVAKFVTPFLSSLPRDFRYARNLLAMALSGRVFTGPRLQAASLSSSDACKGCGERETHHHLFSECPVFAATRPASPPEHSSLSWNTGIIFGPPLRVDSNVPISVPSCDTLFETDKIVFIDGSCYAHFWPRLRTAASAYFVDGIATFA
eukprot:s5196_g2.t1